MQGPSMFGCLENQTPLSGFPVEAPNVFSYQFTTFRISLFSQPFSHFDAQSLQTVALSHVVANFCLIDSLTA